MLLILLTLVGIFISPTFIIFLTPSLMVFATLIHGEK